MILTLPSKDDFSIIPNEKSAKDNPLERNGLKLLKSRFKTLYEQGESLDRLYYLIFGKVVLSKKDGLGNIVQLPQINQGSFIGLSAYYNKSGVSHTATVLNESHLLVIPIKQFKDIVSRWPHLKKKITDQLIHQIDLMGENVYF